MTRVASSFFVASLNYRSVPLGIRERLALTADDVRATLGGFEDLAEVMILSTCNRIEVYGVAERGRATSVFDDLAGRHDLDPDAIRPLVETHAGADAIRHVFRVAASLDSMIVGEPQILGQVKQAFALAQQCRTAGPMLHRVMARTFTVAKRVRTETALGQHAVSMPCAAVEVARKIFGDLAGARALLIGAGEMGQIAARQLRDEGVAALTVTNRARARADALAATLGAVAIPFDTWREALVEADIVITSTSAPDVVVTHAAVRDTLARRGTRPLFFIDIAVPRDVDPAVGELPNVFCYDVDDLGRVVTANAQERAREATKANALIEREVERLAAGLEGLAAVPTIVALREKLEAICDAEVARALARADGAAPETRATLEALSRAIVNKVLHAPTEKLRETSERGAGERWAAAVSELFALAHPPSPAPPAPLRPSNVFAPAMMSAR